MNKEKIYIFRRFFKNFKKYFPNIPWNLISIKKYYCKDFPCIEFSKNYGPLGIFLSAICHWKFLNKYFQLFFKFWKFSKFEIFEKKKTYFCKDFCGFEFDINISFPKTIFFYLEGHWKFFKSIFHRLFHYVNFKKKYFQLFFENWNF